MPVEILLLIALVLALGVIVWLLRQRTRPIRAAAASAEAGRGPSTTGRFQPMTLPRTTEAARLGGTDSVIYGEFDTEFEPEAWRAFLYDPVRVLTADAMRFPVNRLHITLVKLQDDGVSAPDEYRELVQARNAATLELLESAGDPDRDIVITTTIVNHQLGLNPRVVQVYATYS